MNNKIKVFIACGSGIATSTVLQERVKKLFDANNINYSINKGTISQIRSEVKKNDLVLTTTKIQKEYDTPVLQAFGLLTGINEKEIREKILETVETILKEKRE